MKDLLRNSEVWMALFAFIGVVLDKANLVPLIDWQQLIVPALVYVMGRVTSKLAKAKIAPSVTVKVVR